MVERKNQPLQAAHKREKEEGREREREGEEEREKENENSLTSSIRVTLSNGGYRA